MASLRDKEDQQRTDFATGESQRKVDIEPLSAKTLKLAEEAAKKDVVTKKKPKNFDVNFIADEVFDRELEYLPMKPHSDLVICIGPRVENSTKSAIQIDERSANKILDEKLNALGAAFRVLAISDGVQLQRLKFLADVLNVAEDIDILASYHYAIGDYALFQSPLRLLTTFSPEDPTLAYYEVRNMDIKYSMTQEDALKFQPQEVVEDEQTKGE
jgi:hypothetical protein